MNRDDLRLGPVLLNQNLDNGMHVEMLLDAYEGSEQARPVMDSNPHGLKVTLQSAGP